MNAEDLLENARWLEALAQSLARDPHEAEDLVQETWVAALENPPRGGRRGRAWLRKVLRNFAYLNRRGRRRRLRRERVAAAQRDPQAPGEPQAGVERVETLRAVVDCILELKEPYRSTVVLKYVDQLTTSEIAERVGVAPGTVRMRLKRGLDQIRGTFDRRSSGGRTAWLGALAPLAGESLARRLRPGAETAAAQALRWAAILILVAGAAFLAGWRANDPPPVASPPVVHSAPVASEEATLLALEWRIACLRERIRELEGLLAASAIAQPWHVPARLAS
jgi:RNA polymerase sigma-70 factor (ECF subfamily)